LSGLAEIEPPGTALGAVTRRGMDRVIKAALAAFTALTLCPVFVHCAYNQGWI